MTSELLIKTSLNYDWLRAESIAYSAIDIENLSLVKMEFMVEKLTEWGLENFTEKFEGK